MPLFFRIALLLISAFTLVACVSVNTVTLYKASLPPGEAASLSGDGVAFLSGDACVQVSDRGAEIQSMLAGDFVAAKDTVRMVVWIVVARSASGVTFAPDRVRLTYTDGTEAGPKSIQISRFKTRWVQEETLIIRGEEREKIATTDHQPQRDFGLDNSPTPLWDWTRFTIEFPRPAPTLGPRSLFIDTMQQNGRILRTPIVQFERIQERRLVYPGTFADGVGVTDTAYRACRKMQNNVSKI